MSEGPNTEPLVDPTLAAALDGLEGPPAREAFRDDLRQAFLAGEITPVASTADDGAEGVTEEGADSNLADVMLPMSTPLDALLRATEPPEARPEFRAQLRERFLAGEPEEPESFGEPLQPAADSAGHTPPGSPPPRPRSTRPVARPPLEARRQRRRTWMLRALASAALVLVLALLLPDRSPSAGDAGTGDPGQAWQALALAGGPPAFQVDGQAAGPQQDLTSAVVVRAGEEPLRLRLGDLVLVELDPGSSLDLSGARGAGDLDLAMAGDEGGYRVATLAGWPKGQRRLTFSTPEAQVQVTGTIFGVDRYTSLGDGNGTCICCCEGSVELQGPAGGEPAQVQEGQAAFSLAKGGQLMPMDHLAGPHEEPLVAFAELVAGLR